jgi:hypothetical protein
MTGNTLRGGALYIAWKFDTADDRSAARVWTLLSSGESLHLFRLRSRVVVKGEVRALITPHAPLEQIAAAIQPRGSRPVSSRWVSSERACAELAREIEGVPVRLGLARRPEEWPMSSAALD